VESPIVSVVIPTRNRPQLLQRALRSVASQTTKNREVIVVDDASDSPPDEILGLFQLPALIIVRLESRSGACVARNKGLEVSTGQFVAFLDDDDEWLPEKLERQLRAFDQSSPEIGVVTCGYQIVSDITGRVVRAEGVRQRRESVPGFLKSTRYNTSNPLIRRSCLHVTGPFDPELSGSQDRDMWLRLVKEHGFVHLPAVLVTQHIHGHQITTDLPAKIEAKERFLDKHRALYQQYPELLALYLTRLALLCCAGERFSDGLEYLERANESVPSPLISRYLRNLNESPHQFKQHVVDNLLPNVDGIPLYY